MSIRNTVSIATFLLGEPACPASNSIHPSLHRGGHHAVMRRLASASHAYRDSVCNRRPYLSCPFAVGQPLVAPPRRIGFWAKAMASWVGCTWRSPAVGGNRTDRHPHLAASFAGENTRSDAQTLTFQPMAVLRIGGGCYVRSSSIWSFDIPNNKNLMPLAVVGKSQNELL